MTAKPQHTPGPWIARQMTSGHWRIHSEEQALTIVNIPATDSESANARLIAAAPVMLEALENMLALVRFMNASDSFSTEIEQAEAAIAAATEEKS
jgi:hypothetical protein